MTMTPDKLPSIGDAVEPIGADLGPPRTQVLVSMSSLTKTFRRRDGSAVHAIDHVDLDVAAGEFVVLLGPSGCGKTTLLRCVAGLEHATGGRITMRDTVVFDADRGVDLPPESRRLSMIFQSYAVWPHLTVQQNVAFPLRARRVRRDDIAERTTLALETAGIGHLARQYPGQLSGGQQQRVALARALVAGDDLILFDEPLSNVDAKVREQLRFELAAMQREIGFAALYVTHDQDEALELADRVVVLDEGKIVQSGPPREVYREPSSLAVAQFVGSVNALNGTVRAVGEGSTSVLTPLGVLDCDPTGFAPHAGDEVLVLVRPEHVVMIPADADADGPGPIGAISASMYRGQHREYAVALGELTIRVSGSGDCQLEVGAAVRLDVRPHTARLMEPAPPADLNGDNR